MDKRENPDRKHGSGITKWNSNKVEEGYNLSLLGMSDSEMARVWGVAVQTVDLWKKLYPDFKNALKRGKSPANALVAAALFRKATGFWEEEEVVKIYKGELLKETVRKYYPPDTEAIKYFLSSREREKWSHRTEVVNTNINLTRINLSDYSEEDLKAINRVQMKYILPESSGN